MKQEIYCHQCARPHPIGEHVGDQQPQQAAPQTGKTVIGYRELTNAEILAMNQLKQASRAFLAELEAVATHLPEADRRWLAIARTDMQTACMAACRAVTRPSEDN